METYNGYVRTPADAIKLFEACRLGLLPRVQRRLSEKERQSIRSGSVFVWDEREAGMRRWTDGKSWSASRVSGSFLTYREMEGKRGSGFGSTRRSNGRTPDSGRLSDEDNNDEPEGYRYKTDGLMKQSFSITTSQGQHLHLISYYSRPHPGAPDLPQPSTDSQLRHIIPAKGMYPESSLHDANPPALTRAPMQPYAPQTSGPPPSEPSPYGYTWGPPAPNPAWAAPQGAWPPSPSGTPPWMQTKMSTEQPQQQPRLQPQPQMPSPRMQALHAQPPPQLPPPSPAVSGQPPLYPKGVYPYDNERLAPATARSYHHNQPPSTTSSPHLQQLQQAALAAAQAASQAASHAPMGDPRLATTSARNPQGPLPAMSSQVPRMTPPRTHSASPPRTGSSDGTNSINKASLSALLHPTPTNSEPNSANPASIGSANSSPRALTAATAGPPPGHDMYREDVKAIRSLDRKFCI